MGGWLLGPNFLPLDNNLFLGSSELVSALRALLLNKSVFTNIALHHLQKAYIPFIHVCGIQLTVSENICQK